MCENTKHKYKECFTRHTLEHIEELKNNKIGKHYEKWTDEEIRKIYEEVKNGTPSEEMHKMFKYRGQKSANRFIAEARKKYGITANITKSGNNTRPVEQYDLDGNFIGRYNSIHEATKKTGSAHSAILNCCRGLYKQTKGYVWRFVNTEREEN